MLKSATLSTIRPSLPARLSHVLTYNWWQKSDPFTAATVWRTVADISTEAYFFESTMSPNVVWVDLKQIDFDHAQSIDLVNYLAI